MAGTEKGLTPGALMTRLELEAKTRVDAILNTSKHTLLDWLPTTGGGIGTQLGLHIEAPEVPEISGLALPITRYAHQQIAGRSQIPWPYYERMLQGSKDGRAAQQELLRQNVHTWWQSEPESRLVRTLMPNDGGEGRVRAWLSDSFRIIDNRDFVLEVLQAADWLNCGVRVHSCHVDDERLYMQLVTEIEGEARRGDPIRLGITVRNSEVGDVQVLVQPWCLILSCENGATFMDNYARRHLGGNYDQGIVSLETVQKENEAIWSNVRDWVRFALSPENLNRILAQLKRAEQVETPVKARPAVANVVRKMGLNVTEGQALLDRYLLDTHKNGHSQHGMFQALTQVAHEGERPYRRQVELETAGGKVLELEGDAYQNLTSNRLSQEDVEALLGA